MAGETNPLHFYAGKHTTLTRLTLSLIEALGHVADLEGAEVRAADPDPEVLELAEEAEALYRRVLAMRAAVDGMLPPTREGGR